MRKLATFLSCISRLVIVLTHLAVLCSSSLFHLRSLLLTVHSLNFEIIRTLIGIKESLDCTAWRIEDEWRWYWVGLWRLLHRQQDSHRQMSRRCQRRSQIVRVYEGRQIRQRHAQVWRWPTDIMSSVSQIFIALCSHVYGCFVSVVDKATPDKGRPS